MTDEMDLSRADAQRRREEDPLFCPCCGELPAKQDYPQQHFSARIKCINPICGIATPLMTNMDLAVLIWNRRVARKPAAITHNILIDSSAAARHTRQSNARKRGAGSNAGGSQRNRPKRMRKSKVKESSK